jgi:hypothetical protein
MRGWWERTDSGRRQGGLYRCPGGAWCGETRGGGRTCELERRRTLTPPPLRGRLVGVGCAGDHRLDGIAVESSNL